MAALPPEETLEMIFVTLSVAMLEKPHKNELNTI